MIAFVDWFEFTVFDTPFNEIVEVILNLNQRDFVIAKKGKLGYKTQFINQNITLLLNGNEGMGIHGILSGKGCRQLEANTDILTVVSKLIFKKANITRIDLAIDINNSSLLNKIENALLNGDYTMKWKSYKIIKNYSSADNKIIGRTFYFGSRKSDTMLRIYDKSLESGINGDLVRIELELKGKNAENAIKSLKNDFGELVSGILNNYIRFVDNNGTKNKSRWKTSRFWHDIVSDVGKIKLSQKGEERNIEDVKNWIRKQVAPSLGKILIHEEGDFSYFIDEAIYGLNKIKKEGKFNVQ